MGNDNHVVVSHKLCGFQGRVSRHIVVMKEPVVSFSSHISPQASQNVTVQVKARVDRGVRGNKFTVNNPLHIEKTMGILFVELQTYRTFFALGDCGLFHCDDCCFVSGS
jgi:hypothetical protein